MAIGHTWVGICGDKKGGMDSQQFFTFAKLKFPPYKLGIGSKHSTVCNKLLVNSRIVSPTENTDYHKLIITTNSVGMGLSQCDGQGSLTCCSPWGCKELDTTEQLN